ncbi:hypothetical protein BV511_01140 [Methylorubrum extorquens]|nr:hypothetical protein BV511_01140 [Methylorubrum extorquens]ARO55089.1 hypothetical protein B2G69_13795 [Methylorubrum zatmanii]
MKGINDLDRAGSALTVWEMTKSGAKKTEVAQKSAARFVVALDAVEDRILPADREVATLWVTVQSVSEKHGDDTGTVATDRVPGPSDAQHRPHDRSRAKTIDS